MNGTTPTVVPPPASPGPTNTVFDAQIEVLLAAARREMLVIATAQQRPDPAAAFIGAAKLRWLLDFTMSYAAAHPADFQRIYQRLSAIAETAEGWICASRPADPETVHRLLAESLVSRCAPVDAGQCMLIGLDLDDLPLAQLVLRGAKLVRVRALRAGMGQVVATGATIEESSFSAATMRGGVFDGATLTGCNFSYANLEGSHWGGAHVTRCNFAGALLVDAQLEGATFVDCNLRDVALQMRQPFARRSEDVQRMERIKFVRCDLRGSVWEGRSIGRVSFANCITDENRTASGELLVRELPGSEPGDAITRRGRPSVLVTIRTAVLRVFPRPGRES